VIEYKFCEDGTATRAFSPNPKTGMPGHAISTSGFWNVDPDTGGLEIVTIASSMGGAMTMKTTETFPSAFTYDNGTRLDIYSFSAVTIDEFGIGDYHRDAYSLTVVSGIWEATLDAEMGTDLTVTANGYKSTYVLDTACEPPGSMVCNATPASDEVITNGTHTLPLDMYLTPSGNLMFQTDVTRALALKRQADMCDGIDCGENGSCAEGMCICDAGYEGDSCEADINECDPDPCQNSGSCMEGVPGKYVCTCINEYSGVNCQNCPGDGDGDGYGDPANALCAHPQLDCDDSHASVYPGAPELCDGMDNQCPADPGYGSTDDGYSLCRETVAIPAGCFDMGDAFGPEGWDDELPVHQVCVSEFAMDRHEITNAEYAGCVADGGCTAPKSSSSYSREKYYGNPTYNDYPVIWMEWNQLNEYCNWAGKRLPTEAEWEYSARGGLSGSRYPWGDDISSLNANYGMNIGDTSPVESYAPNGYGLYDMAGNVWEWVSDWYNEDYYSDRPYPDYDPTGPANGFRRVTRGGSWDHRTFGLRVANRCDNCHAERHGNNLGGRCVQDVGLHPKLIQVK
jgi:formylglycine-generating enzyme required for sulfatase activity